MVIQDHYEEVGGNALDIFKSDKISYSILYTGYRKSHMWWGEFERLLNEYFTIYDRK